MGNRAVIGYEGDGCPMGLYLHWNGGPESVYAFLAAARALDVRAPGADGGCYYFARLAQIVGNWIGGTLSVGVGPLDRLDCDNRDNGAFMLDRAGEVVERRYARRVDAGDWRAPSTDERLAERREAEASDKYAAILAECLEVNRPIFQRGST